MAKVKRKKKAPAKKKLAAKKVSTPALSKAKAALAKLQKKQRLQLEM